MKTMRAFLTVAVLTVVAFTSCNVNDEIQENVAVRFTAVIDQAVIDQAVIEPAARAAGTTWADGDKIGVFMVNSGALTLAENTGNKQYGTTGSSSFTAVAGDEIYYPINDSKVDFIAYHPYRNDATLTTPIDVVIATRQAADNQPEIDLLWAKADNGGSGYSKTGTNAVALTFDHKLAKLVMNCTADASVGTALTGMTVTITGMNIKNTFDLSTGTLGTPEAVSAITPHTVTNGSIYDAIIMPGAYGNGVVKVAFTVNGEEYTWNVPATTFDGGNEYSYDITITRTGVNFTGTIKPWNEITGDTGTAE